MASSILFQTGLSISMNVGNNRYLPVGTGNAGFSYFSITSTDFPWPFTCTFRNLRVNVISNSRTGLTSGFIGIELYKNTVATGLVVSFAGGATGQFADNVNSVSVTAGDTLSWRMNAGNGGSGSWELGTIAVQVDYASDAPVVFNHYFQGNQIATGNNFVASGTASLRNTGTEDNVKVDSIAGTWSNLSLLATANNRNGDVVDRFRINGVNGNQVITVPASTAGTFTDNSNTDVTALNDDVNRQSVRGGTSGSCTISCATIAHTGDDDKFQAFACGDSAYSPVSATSYYIPIGGVIVNTETDTGSRTIWSLDDYQTEGLEIHVSTNTIASDSTLYFRVNGADSLMSITIPASTTGRFTTTANVSLMDGDAVNFRLAAGGSGNITVRAVGISFGPEPAPPATDTTKMFFALLSE